MVQLSLNTPWGIFMVLSIAAIQLYIYIFLIYAAAR
jgi:hypothetical protein